MSEQPKLILPDRSAGQVGFCRVDVTSGRPTTRAAAGLEFGVCAGGSHGVPEEVTSLLKTGWPEVNTTRIVATPQIATGVGAARFWADVMLNVGTSAGGLVVIVLAGKRAYESEAQLVDAEPTLAEGIVESVLGRSFLKSGRPDSELAMLPLRDDQGRWKTGASRRACALARMLRPRDASRAVDRLAPSNNKVLPKGSPVSFSRAVLPAELSSAGRFYRTGSDEWSAGGLGSADPLLALDSLGISATIPRQSMPQPQNDLLRGTLEALLLKALAAGPRHGYAIARWLEDSTREVLQIEDGSLYPALYRMEQRGWIRSEWGTSDLGRKAKFYVITPAGRKQLVSRTAEWKRFATAVSGVLLPA